MLLTKRACFGIDARDRKEFKDKRKEIEADLEKEKELRKRAQEQ